MNHRVRSLLVIAVVVALDWWSKVFIRGHVSGLDVIPVIPGFFNIVRAENPYAAFSMLADASPRVRALVLIGLSGVVMAVLAAMLWRSPSKAPSETPLMRVGLAIVFGGALGNFLDRVFRGTVTDFIQLFFGSYEFPSFNLADSAINIGAAILIWELWRARKTTN